VPTFNGQFADTADLIGADRLRLAAPADTDGMPRLSLDEAAILGRRVAELWVSVGLPGAPDPPGRVNELLSLAGDFR